MLSECVYLKIIQYIVFWLQCSKVKSSTIFDSGLVEVFVFMCMIICRGPFILSGIVYAYTRVYIQE